MPSAGKAGHPPALPAWKMPIPPRPAKQRRLPPPARSEAKFSSSFCLIFVFSPFANFTNSTLFNLHVVKKQTWKSVYNRTVPPDFPIKFLPPYHLKVAQKTVHFRFFLPSQVDSAPSNPKSQATPSNPRNASSAAPHPQQTQAQPADPCSATPLKPPKISGHPILRFFFA